MSPETPRRRWLASPRSTDIGLSDAKRASQMVMVWAFVAAPAIHGLERFFTLERDCRRCIHSSIHFS